MEKKEWKNGGAIREHLRLYGVTDRSWLHGENLAHQVERALAGGVTVLQLREKEICGQAFLEEALEIRRVTERYGVPLIINDDVEIALACGADGLHVGQSDLDAVTARAKLGPDKILGVSVHSVEEALRAQEQGADYLGAGAVFQTGTKLDAGALSAETLQAICRAVSIPVVAIGGISEKNALQLMGSGVAGLAVVSAIFSKPDIRLAASRMNVLAGWITGGLEGAVFDMDGTLLDSMAIWDAAGENYLRKIGTEPRPDVREALRPLSLLQAAEYFRETYHTEQSVQEIMDGVNQGIEDFYRTDAQLKPGVMEMLRRFSDAGVRMCVATATDRHLVEAALSRTGALPYFSQVFTCGEEGCGKDRPDIFLKASNSLGTAKEKTFVFEDALFAAETVKAAGMNLAVIKDASASGQKDALVRLADLYIEDWRDFF